MNEQHTIPIGTLVEVKPWEYGKHNNMRLYVVEHDRDCDGTPLYSLGSMEKPSNNPLFNKHFHGFSIDSLTVVKLP